MFVAQFQCQHCQNPLEIDPSLLNLEQELNLKDSTQEHQKPLDESFVLLETSVSLNPSATQELVTNNADNASLKSTHSGPYQNLNEKMIMAEKYFNLLSGASIVNHPLCLECSNDLIKKYESKQSTLLKENEVMSKYLKSITQPSAAEMDDLKEELRNLELQEEEAMAMLSNLEAESLQALSELENVKRESDALSLEEERVWKNLNMMHASMEDKFLLREDALSKLASTNHQLEILKKSNVYHDAFRIWHDGPFGTINGLRLGRLSDTPVEWKEINAAIGQALLLLEVLSRKLKFEFKNYRLLPMGSVSKIERITGERSIYELYGSADLVGILFWNRKFDQALVAYLDCISQLGEYAESHDVKFRLPYRIRKDKIGEVSIRLQFNSDELWTKALKYSLINIKWILAFACSSVVEDN